MGRAFNWVMVAVLLGSSATALAEDKPAGYLCCNMRTDGSWISDINYDENGKRIVPVGTPIKVTGYGRFRVKVDLAGKSQAIGNDYSRDLSLEDFARRYVVSEDPAPKIAGYPRKVQEAISSARLVKGMTREQVMMAVGFPVSSENHHIEDKTWRFWVTSFSEFQVHFDDAGVLTEVTGDADAKSKILMD